MTSILATCEFCGDVTLKPTEAVLTDFGKEHRFEFDCPVCDTPMSLTVGRKAVSVLLAVGVEIIQAADLPAWIDRDLGLRRLRDSATYDVETEFRYQLAATETIGDIGWGE